MVFCLLRGYLLQFGTAEVEFTTSVAQNEASGTGLTCGSGRRDTRVHLGPAHARALVEIDSTVGFLKKPPLPDGINSISTIRT